ncbi:MULTISPECIES: phage antirepressor KilAC domain-containing protein [Lactobacillus]|uniref:Oxidoreductase n=1 Tax=Lactobacillus xujianguonis TaxID=2495899 RepID=A0A437SS81_9LACO|nr:MULTISPECIES: phage antirepressor KilAC domain-containing protein [Lactobacillus]RVU69801.1 oxidoreductase [Lactobacillus xujianguonis]RVU71901.1 oxidoreductase [Lactobacillus xujianguonis]
MEDLINIQIKDNQQLVSARELHKGLGLKKKFSAWWEQSSKKFESGTDYTREPESYLVKSGNGTVRKYDDWLLTIDMAKELCMMSETAKGQEVRRYFIQVEKNWNSPDMVMHRALEISNSRVKELEGKNKALLLQAEEMKPKALFADSVATSKSTILVGELAKILRGNGVDIGATRLFKWMREHGYLINRKGSDWNMPTQKAMNLGLFKIKETTITHSDGHVSTSKTPKVTGKGQQYFINKFLKDSKKPNAKEIAEMVKKEIGKSLGNIGNEYGLDPTVY